MDYRCGSSGRTPALEEWSPEFKSQSTQERERPTDRDREKKKTLKNYTSVLIVSKWVSALGENEIMEPEKHNPHIYKHIFGGGKSLEEFITMSCLGWKSN
jgi:hypothetical protein